MNCIIVPSCKLDYDVSKIERCISYCKLKYKLIYTGLNASAPTNRNYGLELAEKYNPEYIIMVDDDVCGFFKNWDDRMIAPLQEKLDVVMVSARLITSTGEPAIMMDINPDMSTKYQCVASRALPSACIAFKYTDLRFDERYSVNNFGSGFEDLDYCWQLNLYYKKRGIKSKYIINNNCRLIHENEMKNQQNIKYFEYLFRKKWGV